MSDETLPPCMLITGAAKRIGAEIARHFAEKGWQLALHYHRSRKEALALAESLTREHGAVCHLLKANLASAPACLKLVPNALKAAGRLDCLVNNAAVFERDTLETLNAGGCDHHMTINVRAPLLLMQSFAEQVQEGNVVNVLDSSRGWSLSPQFFTYTLSKTALWEATLLAAEALAPSIRVNAVGPGPTLPSKYREADAFERIRAATPLERHAEPHEIAEAIAYLLDAPAVTGQMLALSGGLHLHGRR